MSSTARHFRRFSLLQRVEHWLLALAFGVLALTGLPQKYVGAPWAESLIFALGGIEWVRLLHRASATVLMILVIFHAAELAYRLVVRRAPPALLPGAQDWRDLRDTLAYNLGRVRRRPALPRFNFEQKIEYWALVWGTVVMVATGFLLWNPIAATRLLPGAFIPAAKAAHGGEALLAVLAVLVWHLYSVLIRTFNKSMFTGRLSRAEMERDHARELARLENSAGPLPLPAAEVARRRRWFVPIAALVSLAMLAGVVGFVTFEQTAVTTVPPAANAPEPVQFLPIPAPDENIHQTLAEYSGPESCLGSGCYSDDRPVSGADAYHNRRVAVAGPNPLLASLVGGQAESPPNCLICHAQNYRPGDLPASARTVGPAGGNTCRRCHTETPTEDVHAQQQLACLSCHPVANHRFQPVRDCETCHTAQPHRSPVLNVKHARLDCRTCHITGNVPQVVDARRPQQNPETHFFEPTVENGPLAARFFWRAPAGHSTTLASPDAKIVPWTTAWLVTTQNFDPAEFARTGQSGQLSAETELRQVPSHRVFKSKVRACDTCHGPDSNFNYTALGFSAERAAALAAR